ncbi:MAG: branched-chain amino acid aminotransferase [Pseudomonadota bacterium]
MAFIPYDDRDGFIWMDGEFVPWRESKVHVLTHGMHYASTVFEGERAYSGEIYRSQQHSQRLETSAKILGFDLPFTVDQIEDAKREALERSGLENAYVRAFAWRGSEQMGILATETSVRLAIACWHWGDYFADKMAGIRMTNAAYARPSPETAPCHAKASGLYMICTISKEKAHQDGYADALMLDHEGYVAEATGANIFFTRDGAIHTPTADRFLNGITRQSAIRLAKARQIDVVERRIGPEELSSFDECFITGTAAEITPVKEIAEHRFNPGEISEVLVEDYDKVVNRKMTLDWD